MIEIIMWVISFFSVYVAILWLSFYFQEPATKKKVSQSLPGITIAVPAYNEEDTIVSTVKSIFQLKYPPEKLHVIIINDGSTDMTAQKIQELQMMYSSLSIITNAQASGHKSRPLNQALAQTQTELFGCVDADCEVDEAWLLSMIPNFKGKVAAVIPVMHVDDSRSFYTKMQRLEYIVIAFIRRLMSSIGVLSTSPACSVYRTSIVKAVGGFDEHNITEDYEIAMRLRYNHYEVLQEKSSIAWTSVPPTFKELWRQRIRWYRGFISTHWKFRGMIFNSEHGLLGLFQVPLSIIGVFLLVLGTGVILYLSLNRMIEIFMRSILLDGYISSLLILPTLQEIIFKLNLNLVLPIFMGSVMTIYLYILAHTALHRNFKYPFSFFWVLFILPYITCFQWVCAAFDELRRTRRRW